MAAFKEKRVWKSKVKFVLDCFKTPGMCEKVIFVQSGLSSLVHKQFKTQELCDYAVSKNPSISQTVPDSWKTQNGVKNGVKNTYNLKNIKIIR